MYFQRLPESQVATFLALFEAVHDERGIASSLDDIGKLYWLRGEYQKALDPLRTGLMMRRRIGDRRSIALSLNNVGLALQDSGEFKQALELHPAHLGAITWMPR